MPQLSKVELSRRLVQFFSAHLLWQRRRAPLLKRSCMPVECIWCARRRCLYRIEYNGYAELTRKMSVQGWKMARVSPNVVPSIQDKIKACTAILVTAFWIGQPAFHGIGLFAIMCRSPIQQCDPPNLSPRTSRVAGPSSLTISGVSCAYLEAK